MGHAQHIARTALLLSALAAASCAARAPAEPDPAADAALAAPFSVALSQASRELPRPPGALVVRLAFGAEADLDVYVTDAQRETVYFANTLSRSGGRLDRDRTCADAAPRVETVIFEHPAPGHYRVGVDYSSSCMAVGGAVPYGVEATYEGHRQEIQGTVEPHHFVPVVLEMDVD